MLYFAFVIDNIDNLDDFYNLRNSMLRRLRKFKSEKMNNTQFKEFIRQEMLKDKYKENFINKFYEKWINGYIMNTLSSIASNKNINIIDNKVKVTNTNTGKEYSPIKSIENALNRMGVFLELKKIEFKPNRTYEVSFDTAKAGIVIATGFNQERGIGKIFLKWEKLGYDKYIDIITTRKAIGITEKERVASNVRDQAVNNFRYIYFKKGISKLWAYEITRHIKGIARNPKKAGNKSFLIPTFCPEFEKENHINPKDKEGKDKPELNPNRKKDINDLLYFPFFITGFEKREELTNLREELESIFKERAKKQEGVPPELLQSQNIIALGSDGQIGKITLLNKRLGKDKIIDITTIERIGAAERFDPLKDELNMLNNAVFNFRQIYLDKGKIEAKGGHIGERAIAEQIEEIVEEGKEKKGKIKCSVDKKEHEHYACIQPVYDIKHPELERDLISKAILNKVTEGGAKKIKFEFDDSGYLEKKKERVKKEIEKEKKKSKKSEEKIGETIKSLKMPPKAKT